MGRVIEGLWGVIVILENGQKRTIGPMSYHDAALHCVGLGTGYSYSGFRVVRAKIARWGN